MKRFFLPVCALLLSFWCSPSSAQSGARSSEPVTLWRLELAQIERRLQELQEEALREPELAQLDSLLGAELAAAMARHDPDLDADAADDRFLRARAAALADPGLADRVEVFNEAVRLRMIEKHPDAVQLFARQERLSASLSGATTAP